VGADTAGCLAHVVGGASEDWYDYYTPGCTGHDEPELDPVSSAPHSARDVTWHVALPADGTFPVTSVGPTFWFGGTVKDSNPAKIGGEGFLEMQFYPDSFTKRCAANGGFDVKQEPGVYTVCSPVWTIAEKKGQIIEPAAFNGMLMNASGTGPLVMHARDIVDIHIWAPSMNAAYREQVRDESSGETSSVLTLISKDDGPLTPASIRTRSETRSTGAASGTRRCRSSTRSATRTSTAPTPASSASRDRRSAARSTTTTGPACSRPGSST
jgi:hypothetical protein